MIKHTKSHRLLFEKFVEPDIGEQMEGAIEKSKESKHVAVLDNRTLAGKLSQKLTLF